MDIWFSFTIFSLILINFILSISLLVGKGGQQSRRGILLDDDDDDARGDLHNFRGPRRTLHDYFIDLSGKRYIIRLLSEIGASEFLLLTH